MAKGTIYGTTNNEFIECKIEWSSVANNTAATSTVQAMLYYRRTNYGYTTYGTMGYTLFIGSDKTRFYKQTTGQKVVTIGTEWVAIDAVIATVVHDSDGRKDVYIGATGSISGTTLTSTNCGEMVSLDTIALASTITSVTCGKLDEPIKVQWSAKSSVLNYKLTFKVGTRTYTTDTIAQNVAGSYTYSYTLPFKDVAECFPNANRCDVEVTLTTFSGTNQVGSASTKSVTIDFPDNASTQPTVSMSLAPSSNLSSPYNSLYIQGFSKVKATLNFGTKYGATVVASSITVNGKSYESPYESDILTQDGKITVKATVKDSRGFYGTIYKDIEVIPYSKPYVRAKSGESSIIAARCDSSANFTDSGTYLKIKAKAVYSKVISGGVQKNYGKIKFRYRKEGGTYSAWQTILDCKTNNSDEVITPPLLNGALDIKSNYQVEIIASDDFYDSVPVTIPVPSDAVYMHRPVGGKSMGLGGYSSGDGNLDIHWKTKARGGLSLFDSKGDEIPLGTTLPLPRDQIKGDWNPDNLECGVHVVANNNALKAGDTVIMYNGVLIQMKGDVGGNVKLQLALPIDTNRNPMYRLCWYSNWSDWRSMKI